MPAAGVPIPDCRMICSLPDHWSYPWHAGIVCAIIVVRIAGRQLVYYEMACVLLGCRIASGQECIWWSRSCRRIRHSPAESWFVCVCGDIAEIGSAKKIDDKRLLPMTINFFSPMIDGLVCVVTSIDRLIYERYFVQSIFFASHNNYDESDIFDLK